MSRQNKKKSFSLDGSLRWGVFFLLVANFVVIYTFERDRVPRVIYQVTHEVVTNDLRSVDFVPRSGDKVDLVVPENVRSNLVVACSVCYDYFYANGRVVRIWDRYFQEGSPCSYGRIKRIYPDRIFLEDGSVIINTKWMGGSNEKTFDNAGVADGLAR